MRILDPRVARGAKLGRTALFLVLAFVMAAPAHAGTPATGWTDTAYATGMNGPTALAFLPDGRLLVTQKGGTGNGLVSTALLLFDDTTISLAGTFDVCTEGEGGLLGLAVDPSFAVNGFLYLFRTVPSSGMCVDAEGTNQAVGQVLRVRLGADGTVDPASAAVLLDGITTGAQGLHNGGGLEFGLDGNLYVSVGDTHQGDSQGGPGSSTNIFAQDLASLNGKILRLDRSGAIPADNPFVGRPGARPEIFAYGFRNPWRFGFDPETGALWAGDVGDFTWEEINIVVGGGNYGFPHCEGIEPVGCEQQIPGGDPIVAPILTIPHTGTDLVGQAVIGGAFAPQSGPFAEAGLAGDYFFADLGSPRRGTGGTLWHAVPTPGRDGIAATPTMIVGAVANPVEVVFGPDGALYYVTFAGGEVRRVSPMLVTTTSTSPSTTSSTTSTTSSTTSTTSSTTSTTSSTTSTTSSTTSTTSSTTSTTSSTTSTTSSTTSTTSSSTSTTSSSTTTSSTTTTLLCSTATCILAEARTNSACRDQVIPPGVTRRFDRAVRLIDRANAPNPPREPRKIFGKATRALERAAARATRATRGRKPRLSSECAAGLEEAAARVVAALQV